MLLYFQNLDLYVWCELYSINLLDPVFYLYKYINLLYKFNSQLFCHVIKFACYLFTYVCISISKKLQQNWNINHFYLNLLSILFFCFKCGKDWTRQKGADEEIKSSWKNRNLEHQFNLSKCWQIHEKHGFFIASIQTAK